MGRLPGSAIRDFECHLLVCHRCQDRMADMDAFLTGMREACSEMEPQRVAVGSGPVN